MVVLRNVPFDSSLRGSTHMRKYSMPAFVLAAMLVFATSGLALEKTALRIDDASGGWNADLTCSIAYYNTCTGWVWLVGGFSPNFELGVCYDKDDGGCCEPSTHTDNILTQTVLRIWTTGPAGYGFTGTIGVFNADPNCCAVGAPLASQVFFPGDRTATTYVWGIPVPDQFVVKANLGPGVGNPIRPVFDNPDTPIGGVPGNPIGCGTCYPTTRRIHSFFYGTPTSPLCPGSPWGSGASVCDAELLWVAQKTCEPVSVEASSWGSVKSLYR